MRVNELVYRLDDDELVHIKDIDKKKELFGFKKDIITNELFKKQKLGDLLVTSIHLEISHDDPFSVPVMLIMAEK